MRVLVLHRIHIQWLRKIRNHSLFRRDIGQEDLLDHQDKGQAEDRGHNLAEVCTLLLPLIGRVLQPKCSELVEEAGLWALDGVWGCGDDWGFGESVWIKEIDLLPILIIRYSFAALLHRGFAHVEVRLRLTSFLNFTFIHSF